ncbi:MAG: ATP phosphoribosyltransferase regulatory subunit, partial [Hungatella sp.]
DSSGADAEMIAMVIHSLKSVGLQEFQVELGQVEFFRGLVEEAGMEAETQEILRELIENKNYFGVEELIQAQPMTEELRQVFLKLPE